MNKEHVYIAPKINVLNILIHLELKSLKYSLKYFFPQASQILHVILLLLSLSATCWLSFHE